MANTSIFDDAINNANQSVLRAAGTIPGVAAVAGALATADKVVESITQDTEPFMSTTPIMDYSGHQGQYYCTLNFIKYQRPVPFSPPTNKVSLAVNLPLPRNLSDYVQGNWSSADLNGIGDIFNAIQSGAEHGLQDTTEAAILRNAGSITALGTGLISGIIGGVLTKGMGTQAGSALGSKLNQLVDPAAIQNYIQAQAGIAPNPNQTYMFKGPSYRRFTFEWQFSPRSETESMSIQKMITRMKAAALPTARSAGFAALLDYPYMVRLNFFPWDTPSADSRTLDPTYGWTEKSFMRIKTCVITDLETNYAPSGNNGFFQNSKMPAAITVRITLQEIEYLLSHDYDDSMITTIRTAVASAPASDVNNPSTNPPVAAASRNDTSGSSL